MQKFVAHTTITVVEIAVPIFVAFFFVGLLVLIWRRYGHFEPEYQEPDFDDESGRESGSTTL